MNTNSASLHFTPFSFIYFAAIFCFLIDIWFLSIYQLIRIHSRNPLLGWNRQKVILWLTFHTYIILIMSRADHSWLDPENLYLSSGGIMSAQEYRVLLLRFSILNRDSAAIFIWTIIWHSCALDSRSFIWWLDLLIWVRILRLLSTVITQILWVDASYAMFMTHAHRLVFFKSNSLSHKVFGMLNLTVFVWYWW